MVLTSESSVIENEHIFFDHECNILKFKFNDVVITLTELQTRLFFLILTGTTKKDDIIKKVWPSSYVVITDNNYHQLVYQCRALLSRHGISADVIKTIPRHGIKFNYSMLNNNQLLVPKTQKLILQKVLGFFSKKRQGQG